MATLRELTGADLTEAEQLLDAALGGRWQVRLNEVVDVLDLPGIVACDGGQTVGIATWIPGGATELTCLAVAADHRLQGIGGALVEAVVVAAVGADSVWLVTTNDNLDALRLYQRHGFRIERVVVGGVDAARRLKPQIPTTGSHGIPLHDELVLRRRLD